MATLADGSRVFSAVDSSLILAADHNDLQDVLIDHLKALTVAVPITSGNCDKSFGTPSWYFRKALGWWAWQTLNRNTAIVFPLGTLRTGQVVTAVSATVRGTANAGSIILYRQAVGTPAAPVSTATWAADPWATAGADIAKSATAGLPFTVLTNYEYYIEFTPSAFADPQYIHGAQYTAQLGT